MYTLVEDSTADEDYAGYNNVQDGAGDSAQVEGDSDEYGIEDIASVVGRTPADVVGAEDVSTAAAAGTVIAAEAAGGHGRQEEDCDRAGEREQVSMMQDRCRQVEMSPITLSWSPPTPNITAENSLFQINTVLMCGFVSRLYCDLVL